MTSSERLLPPKSGIDIGSGVIDGQRHAKLIVAIPAKDEAERIPACLAALAMQRDAVGVPLPTGTFEVLLLANNCTDTTARVAREMAATLPFRLDVVERRLPPDRSNAGFARKCAMDLAADRLSAAGAGFRAILTTDADSRVSPTWVSATMRSFAAGADCVAGYIDADPMEIVRLGAGFLERGRREDRYIGLIAEIEARCDPRPHDPWPNHRVSSGASLAVSLQAYRAIGGLPALPLGEDAALTRELDAAGFHVRHAMDVSVTTSCRFDGRAVGGAADTMRLRHAELDAPCDDDLEPAHRAMRRVRLRRALRHAPRDAMLRARIAARLALAPDTLAALEKGHPGRFDALWRAVEARSPALVRSRRLRPSDLAAETARAERLLERLRGRPVPAQVIEPIDIVVKARVDETLADRLLHE